ncbi:hypothetical protein [Ruminococcus gauvreauii]|uniref:Uncharacterized protein n=1 Tax=Ruminococcus gauvreauii TaxID=438033 RepID=A0ABY5VIQ2_9FIRM|nr:hypothetical protein [Ruminococcus gauvreauii]UWP59856.1 hypothetical protein NQ502_01990 [Ruminococcus gauvreauii]
MSREMCAFHGVDPAILPAFIIPIEENDVSAICLHWSELNPYCSAITTAVLRLTVIYR